MSIDQIVAQAYYLFMINIPKDIAKYLVRDEIVEKEFILKGQKAYASTNRLFIKKGGTVRDFSYNHISSIEFKSKPQWLMVLVGLLAVVVGYFLQQGNTLGWALIIVGVVLIIGGFFWKSEAVELCVVGVSVPWRFTGQRQALDSLFRLVREHRV
jgi:hypothetical protein